MGTGDFKSPEAHASGLYNVMPIAFNLSAESTTYISLARKC